MTKQERLEYLRKRIKRQFPRVPPRPAPYKARPSRCADYGLIDSRCARESQVKWIFSPEKKPERPIGERRTKKTSPIIEISRTTDRKPSDAVTDYLAEKTRQPQANPWMPGMGLFPINLTERGKK